ncbi:MAG: patatin-like phospholipase family protein [Leptospiraceae bacterium]|nr:patatin-like phospholipase family protein [Leptospiraceae bacterium]
MKYEKKIIAILCIGIFQFHCITFSKIFKEKKVCIVLSVGGAKGIAQIGAIDALKKKNVGINCVFGNSMGSVIGSLYATDPDLNLKERYRDFIAKFLSRSKSKQEKKGDSTENILMQLGKSIFSEKNSDWLTILGKLTESIINSTFYTDFDNEQFREVLNEFFENKDISQTRIPFATSYHAKKGDGLELVVASNGNLSEAVARSANNPFIFKNTDIMNLQYLDPGSDRVASVPVTEACLHFKPTQIIAINVTGQKAFYSSDMNCAIKEIMVNIHYTPHEALKGTGEEFEKMYNLGFAAVEEIM